MKYLLLIFIGTILYSCSIRGTFQGLYSYYYITMDQNPNLIQKPTGSICSLSTSTNPIVYTINGSELRACISKFDRVLIYSWSPKCSSQACLPLEFVQRKCTEENIELFIISEYYDAQKMSKNYDIINPIFGIDCVYYGTQKTSKYVNYFFSDLLGDDFKNQKHFYYFFEEGKYKAGSKSFEELNIN